MEKVAIKSCGIVEYGQMSEKMRVLQRERIEGKIGDTLIFVEHPEIVTIGPKAIREDIQVEGYPTSITDRGGGITWHGPGQIVVYPIIKWRTEEQSVRGIIGKLEDWAIAAMSGCGIDAYKDPVMQGAWVDGFKVCSIGLSFLHWVSRHGMSINIDTPGNRVENLEGCGIGRGSHTSLARLGYHADPSGNKIDSKMIQDGLIETCEEILGRKPTEYSGQTREIAA
tara:strand:- start:49521 stop:50195 length:675 start_codon:yes stop_codon:yes gene_type:complete